MSQQQNHETTTDSGFSPTNTQYLQLNTYVRILLKNWNHFLIILIILGYISLLTIDQEWQHKSCHIRLTWASTSKKALVPEGILSRSTWFSRQRPSPSAFRLASPSILLWAVCHQSCSFRNLTRDQTKLFNIQYGWQVRTVLITDGELIRREAS